MMIDAARHTKEPYKRDYILQQRPIILGSLFSKVLLMIDAAQPPKESYKRDYILQKRPISLRSLLSEELLMIDAAQHTKRIHLLPVKGAVPSLCMCHARVLSTQKS